MQELREQTTVEQLAAAFDKLAQPRDFSFVDTGKVELKFFPSVGPNQPRTVGRLELLKKRGALNLHGWIKNKQQGKQISFQFALELEDKQWRPTRITFGIPEPYQADQK